MFIKFLRCICIATIFMAANSYAAERVIEDYKIKGINGDLEKNVALYLKQLKGEKPTRTLQRYAKKQVQNSIKALGYYSPTIEVEFNKDDSELVVKIERGPATRIDAINITLNGEGKSDTQLQTLIKNTNLKQGEVLNHGKYESAYKKIESMLLERGYFDAKWPARKLEVSIKKNSAVVTFVINTGVRYQYGSIEITSDTPAEKYIRSLAPFTQGQPYKSTYIADYNLKLSSTPYFASVRVYADITARKIAQVPIKVEVIPKPANSFEIGGGFSTDLGPRVRFKWSKPWITEDGHYLDTNMNIAEKQQDLSMAYTVPVDDPNDDLWRFSVGYKLEDELADDTYSEILTAQLQRQWLTEDKWVRTAFLRRDQETFRLGDDPKESTEMLMPGISYARKNLKGGTTPYWGEQWLISAEFGLDDALSSTNLLRVQLQHAWLRTYLNKHLVFLKANVGAMLVDDINNVPYSLRFYAGGDQSVRGFAYQSISPENEDGELIGGKYLLAGTMEYNYQFAQNWRAALFVDGGTATNDFSDEFEVGAGFGFRYLTPVGPIRIDHAWGLTKESKSTRLSITIGPEI
ncbi:MULTISPECIES: autotransporter assembly complex family protein [unclassified Pseudoalteromonas]|uniref:autotransporter assembly complex protein TamA n=1 Tax=unclassified Pseudoalteromonas TaxID=194690 RepID=UPI0011098B54|nr:MULTISPECIES: autotransporter assembly complex family protein [unclassified Pseudoalteromonas]TMN83885.1 outer membrane protein assembly factor [Pseudoalteromonas sp. S410]TMN89033.1 outer membrane protein assembly factor [Pseudoalteromonas sp. S408]TMN98750.1 outer membrane protein assembly factor [Pseudoalteromonas sp. S407]TMO01617.1 outer membrane protein assembly factor [Pseudoalteromonas sp. S409]TMO07852.1 outer membrane protein assembly factor [Pseudoalteromonas sp. S186]